jgi:hypothetical protein
MIRLTSLKPAVLALCAAVMLSSATAAHEFTAGDLTIGHPYIPAPIAAAKSAGGYLTVTNSGSTPDRLIGVEVPQVAQAMLHTTTFSADGVATMSHLEAIDIPAGATVALERGGMHVMLMGLAEPLTVGQLVPATLIFETAGRVEVEFSVDEAAKGDDPHANH